MSTQTTAADAARQELGATFSGTLIGPEDSGYDDARAVFNAMIDRHPSLIARCETTADVAATIAFARDHDLLLAVRGAGHNGGGLGVCDDGVVLDLAGLNSVEVDPANRTIRAGGGCTWNQVDAAAHPHGLSTPSGIISSTEWHDRQTRPGGRCRVPQAAHFDATKPNFHSRRRYAGAAYG